MKSDSLSASGDDGVEMKLETLCCISDLLGLDEMSPLSYTTALMELSNSLLELQRTCVRLEVTEEELKECLDQSTYSQELLVNAWKRDVDANATVVLERKAIGMSAKAEEYQQQLVDKDVNQLSVTELLQVQEEIRITDEEVRKKRARIRGFQGLPPNIAQAKRQVKHEKERLFSLIELRERLLSKISVK